MTSWQTVSREKRTSLAGPVFLEHDYEARGRILAISETPQTEYLWYESTLADPRPARPSNL